MFQVGDVVVRIATADDVDRIVDFVSKNIGITSDINKALHFNERDSRANYELKIRHAIPDGLSMVAIDTSTNEVVGAAIGSKWTRDDPTPCSSPAPASYKCKHLYNIVSYVRSHFWSLCPKDMNAVVRGECFLIRRDFQRNKIGAKILQFLSSEEFLKAKSLDGLMGCSTSNANIKNMTKLGAISLAELEYDEYFTANGIAFEGALCDGTTKCVLQVVPVKKFQDYKVEMRKVRWTKSKI